MFPRIDRMFAALPDKPDHPALELEILELWERERTFERLREQNRGGPKFSFVDGPVTANRMVLGVHTAWGRTLKDVFQRYKALRGHEQRYQNGFDCQGLWIEVGVERRSASTRSGRSRSTGSPSSRAVPGGRRPVVARADRGLDPARAVDGLGQGLLHLQRHEHRVHLALPAARARARLALPRPPLDRVVPALRHLDLRARARRQLRRPCRPVALRPAAAPGPTGRGARDLDDDAVDAAGQRGGSGEAGRRVRPPRERRLGGGRPVSGRDLRRAEAAARRSSAGATRGPSTSSRPARASSTG